MRRSSIAIHQEDEFYLVLRGNVYHLHATYDGRRYRMSCGTTDLARAKAFLENKRREMISGWREDYNSADKDWKDVAVAMCDRHKRGAFRRGIPFDLTPAAIYALMRSTSFRCAVSGIPFAKRAISNGKRDPWAPSIDRIENRQGYSVENVRIVALIANIAMGDWGFDTLLRLSRGVHRSSLTIAEELTQGEPNSGTNPDNQLLKLVKSD